MVKKKCSCEITKEIRRERGPNVPGMKVSEKMDAHGLDEEKALEREI